MWGTVNVNMIANFVFINSDVSEADFEWKPHTEVIDEIIAILVLWLTLLCVLPIWLESAPISPPQPPLSLRINNLGDRNTW